MRSFYQWVNEVGKAIKGWKQPFDQIQQKSTDQ
jgi:hypothetical protein